MTNSQKKDFSNPFNQESFDQQEYPGRANVCIVCSTPRSGSNLLCDLLRQNGIGVPHEYFHTAEHLPILARRFRLISDSGALNFSEYVETLLRHRTTPSGWFALKIHYGQLSWLNQYTSLMDIFPTAKYLYIYRKDLLAQAVSMTLAEQTQQWHHKQVPIKSPEYNFHRIDRNLRSLEKANSDWKRWMTEHGIEPCQVIYEDLIDNPGKVASKLSGYLNPGLSLEFALEESIFERQSDDVNRQWIDQFTLDHEQL